MSSRSNGIGAWGAPEAGPGHNAGPAPETQWQVPHAQDGHGHDQGDPAAGAEPDFDLVEASFVEGFWAARSLVRRGLLGSERSNQLPAPGGHTVSRARR